MRDYDGAEAALHESLRLDLDQSAVLHHWIHLRQKQCKWPIIEGLDTDISAVLEHASPLAMLGMTDDPAEQLRAAQNFVKMKVGTFERMAPASLRYGHERIRIGYMSSDLSMHAVSLLMVELFETHDRERFANRDFQVHAVHRDNALRPLAVGFHDAAQRHHWRWCAKGSVHGMGFQQANAPAPVTSAFKGGMLWVQAAMVRSQRGANGHPGGELRKSGGEPRSVVKRPPRGGRAAATRPAV
jgi:hypothetical protein